MMDPFKSPEAIVKSQARQQLLRDLTDPKLKDELIKFMEKQWPTS